MFLFQCVWSCGGYKCRCAEAAGREILQGWIGIDSVNNKGDSLNSFSVRHDVFKQQFTPLAIGMQGHGAKDVGPTKVLKQCRSISSWPKAIYVNWAQVLCSKSCCFSSNSLWVTFLNKDITPREQRDRTMNSRTAVDTEGS